jgi:hypothetical protein
MESLIIGELAEEVSCKILLENSHERNKSSG